MSQSVASLLRRCAGDRAVYMLLHQQLLMDQPLAVVSIALCHSAPSSLAQVLRNQDPDLSGQIGDSGHSGPDKGPGRGGTLQGDADKSSHIIPQAPTVACFYSISSSQQVRNQRIGTEPHGGV